MRNDRVAESFLQVNCISPCLPRIVVFRQRIAQLRVSESDRAPLVKTEHHINVAVRVVIPDLNSKHGALLILNDSLLRRTSIQPYGLAADGNTQPAAA
ncbi:hypothetical protein AB3X96_37040 [Paraburkholderia sp. BR13439]|uniref:hypothetical protein n=1 Tax=unclassified Paraburkholderia TaxID=2615204 RepID=UPI0034CEFC42